MKRVWIFSLIFLLLAMPLIIADHPGENDDHEEPREMKDYLFLLYITSVISGLAIVWAMVLRANPRKFEKYKKIIFLIIVIPIAFTSLFLVGNTIYENVISVTKGPVHWHADFEIYICDELIDPIDPKGLSNKIGTPLFHEHGDFRIHVEGAVFDYEDVNLPSFFEVIGGELTEELIAVPTNEGLAHARNGDLCNGQPGVLNIFAYKTSDEGIVTQQKITDVESYRYAESSIIPPGDCIIIEFGEEKETTDRICTLYQIALEKEDISYGS